MRMPSSGRRFENPYYMSILRRPSPTRPWCDGAQLFSRGMMMIRHPSTCPRDRQIEPESPTSSPCTTLIVTQPSLFHLFRSLVSYPHVPASWHTPHEQNLVKSHLNRKRNTLPTPNPSPPLVMRRLPAITVV